MTDVEPSVAARHRAAYPRYLSRKEAAMAFPMPMSREDLIIRLARVSRDCSIEELCEQGLRLEDLDTAVTDHDTRRSHAIVEALERLGIVHWPHSTQST
jgi:hypothetical protein